jgi:methylated-DNA-[protein]-cysteine S-methyltransferase
MIKGGSITQRGREGSNMKTTIPISGCRTTKVYCRPGCPPGRRTKPENRIYFKSREEARARGYRACKVCRPDESFSEVFFLTDYQSPLGPYILVSSRWGVVGLKNEERAQIFIDRWERANISVKYDGAHYLELKEQLDAYFAGQLRQFTIPLDLRGTPFQRQVWDTLRMIPWGKTRSYGQIAAVLGRPGAARAVGRAVGTNPVSIVVPCHRVIGSNSALTGYGGGLDRKAALLKLEDSKAAHC